MSTIKHMRNAENSRRPPTAACSLLPLMAAGLLLTMPVQARPPVTPPPANALPVPSTNAARPFVFAGAASVATNGSAMTVNTTSRATGLNWDSFNIGANASVNVAQPDAASRVLNRIWSSDPSVIMGRLSSNGQVYLINQNGILFGAGSQVNVGGLVASALNVSDDLLHKGLPAARGDGINFGWEGTVAGFSGSFVAVDAGANITTPAGSRVVLLAPQLAENAGTINAGAGSEVILGAGGSVLLTAPADPNLRGLLVQTRAFKGTDLLGGQVSLDGNAANRASGQINTAAGVVSLAALAVNQEGVVAAGKAINLNGDIILVAGSNSTDHTVINQRGSKARIDWQSGLDIDAGQSVEFVQPGTGAIAYNFINDHSFGTGAGRRSTIDGVLSANGQVMLINEMGIDFGPNARVSAANFVASGLGINPSVVALDLYSIADVAIPSFSLRSLDDPTAALAAFRQATINVASGATIAAGAGGYALLLGSQVNQGGTITTPQGQTVLAAGAKVYLKPPYSQALRGFTAEVDPLYLASDSTRTALSRGIDSNRITQTGSITAALGDITLVGHDIVQAGRLESSTSVTQNGSIHLLARDLVGPAFRQGLDSNGLVSSAVKPDDSSPFFVQGAQTGAVTLQAGSSASILLEGDASKTITAKQGFIPSIIAAEAARIEVAGATADAPGASLLAHGGTISLFANDSASGSSSKVFIGDGASIDVSGATAHKSVADLFVRVELRGDELANNPVQRNGKLRGQTAWVDSRDAVAIADLSGYFNRIGQTIEERTATGGTILVGSSGSLILKAGSVLNVSGGQVDYAAALVNESKAVLARGAAYRLNDAPTDLDYSGLITISRNEQAYREGKSAGTVSLSANRLAVDATLIGSTVRGARQRDIGDPATSRTAIPLGGQLMVRDAGQHFLPATDGAAMSQAQIRFVNGAAGAAQSLNATDSAGPRLDLSASGLVDGGFTRLSLTSDGRIDVGPDINLALGAGGSFSASGRQVYVGGRITAPGGSISLVTRDLVHDLSQSDTSQFPSDPNASTLTVDSGAVLSIAGSWVNDYLDASAAQPAALAVNGGKLLSLVSAYDIDLRAGSLLDVSGGARVKSNGTLTVGNAGSISLTTGRFGLQLGDGSGKTDLSLKQDSSLFLDGTLAGYALGQGGKLDINTSRIRFSASAPADAKGLSRSERLSRDLNGITLTSGFLDRGGFYRFNLTGNDGVTVASDLSLEPRPVNWSLAGVSRFVQQKTGSSIGSFANSVVLDSALRSGVTTVGMTTNSAYFGDLVVGERSRIAVSAQGSINLASKRNLVMLGTLQAPGGTITLSHTANQDDDLSSNPKHAIWLGASSQLLAGGTTLLDASTTSYLQSGLTAESLLAQGAYKGKVLNGGSVAIDAGLGYVVTEAGSLIDVQGASDTLSAFSASAGRAGRHVDQGLASGGGTVSLTAREGLFIDGALNAGGATGALGGTFALSFGTANFKDWNQPAGALAYPRQLTLYQTPATKADGAPATHEANLPSGLTAALFLSGEKQIAQDTYDGKARLDLRLLQNAGFGSWYLQSGTKANFGKVVFEGTIHAEVPNQLRLDSRSFAAASDATNIDLQAAAIQIGNYSVTSDSAKRAQNLSLDTPSTGNAQATFSARDIGLVGNFLWNGFKTTTFDSDKGDIHLDSQINTVANTDSGRTYNGMLKGTGTVNLKAARVFPSTYSDFSVDMSADTASKINISRPVGTDYALAAIPLSVAGNLSLKAQTIDQQGSVFAPFGVISFKTPDASGSLTLGGTSVTSVAGDQAVPFGLTSLSGREWDYTAHQVSYGELLSNIYVVGSADGTVARAPEKSVILDAGKVTVASGAIINLSGGGSPFAHEFTPGPGGKTDILSPNGKADPAVFAVLPGFVGRFAPADSQSQIYYDSSVKAAVAGSTSVLSPVPVLKAGDQISIADNGSGLAGVYTLLPASYGLMPGAYLVSVKPGQPATVARAQEQADHSWLVAGSRLASNRDGSFTAYDSQPLALEVAAPAVVKARARYNTTTAKDYFAQDGAQLPGDAGHLSVAARQTLSFDPVVYSAFAGKIGFADGSSRGGYGAEVDIAAPRMFVTDGSGPAPGADWAVLQKSGLEALQASSLLLGGIRQQAGNTNSIETVASRVEVQTSGSDLTADSLHAPEILLTASGIAGSATDAGILIHRGSILAADSGNVRQRSFSLSGDGAFVRVANGAQADYARHGTVTRNQGDLVVEAGATIDGVTLAGARLSGRAVILDATRHDVLGGDVVLRNRGERQNPDGSFDPGGAISVAANRINVVGDASVPADGLVFSNASLAQMGQPDSLRLISYGALDLYGDAVLGKTSLRELIVSAAGIAGHGHASTGPDDAPTTASLIASKVVLENLNPGTALFSPGAALGSGNLAITAQNIAFSGNATSDMRSGEQGGFLVQGFAKATLSATEEVHFGGIGVSKFGDGGQATQLTIDAGRMVAASGSDHLLVASGQETITGGSFATPLADRGGKLALQAKSFDISGRIQSPSGRLVVHAVGSDAGDGVTLSQGARLLADGVEVSFDTATSVYAPAGRIALASDHGNVSLGAGALISVMGSAGSDAGSVLLLADNGSVLAAAATLQGTAAATDLDHGQLLVDAKYVVLDDLVAATTAPNGNRHFTQSWQVRSRSGDLSLGEGKTIKANAVTLATDRGNIDIYGTVDASGPSGGKIELYAGSQVLDSVTTGGQTTLHDGGQLKANATEVVAAASNTGTQGQGGRVVVGGDGNVNLEPGGLVDVSAATGSLASGGTLTLRAKRSNDASKIVAPTATVSSIVNTTETYTLPGSTSAYSAGMVVSFSTGQTNATSSSLISVNGLPAQQVFKGGTNTPLAASDIPTGQTVVAMYDGASFQITSFGLPAAISGSATVQAPNTISMTVTGFTAYAQGQVFRFTATRNNTGAATLNIRSKGARPLVNADGTILAANRIVIGATYTVVYDGGAFRLLPATLPTTVAATYNAIATGASTYMASSPDSAYTKGQVVSFTANGPNAGNTSLDVNSLGAKTLLTNDGSALAAGQIKAGEIVVAVYDGSNFRITSVTSDAMPSPNFGTGVAASPIASTVRGTSGVIVEANKVYDFGATDVDLNVALQAKLSTDNYAFMRYALDIGSGLTLGRGDGLIAVVRPGVELRTAGNLTVSQDFNLEDFRQGGQPGTLTLRAAGNINFNSVLSDGFSAWGSNTGKVTATAPEAKIDTGGASWSYRISAGADLQAADPLGTIASPMAHTGSAPGGNIVLAPTAMIRTGTGSIDMTAGGSILLQQSQSGSVSAGARIYTAGVQDTSPMSGFSGYGAVADNQAQPKSSAIAAFATGGGAISLAAGADIRAEGSSGQVLFAPQPTSDWALATAADASADVSTGGRNLQWWPRIASFREGIAAFGGGNVAISAGGDISSLTVVIPTNGRVPNAASPSYADAVIQGGGRLNVSAGGSIKGGQFYAESGPSTLLAGNNIAPISAGGVQSYTEIDLGNAPVRLVAGGDLTLGSVFNPLEIGRGAAAISGSAGGLIDLPRSFSARMGSYGESSGILATSLTGNLTLMGQQTDALQGLMPGRIRAAALDGSIFVSGSLLLMPQSQGQLDLLAHNDIVIGEAGIIRQLDLPQVSVPSLGNPLFDVGVLQAYSTAASVAKHSPNSVYLGNSTPNHLIAENGNISAPVTGALGEFAKPVRVLAGGDIVNPNLVIQHSQGSDASSLRASGDISFETRSGGENLGVIQVNGPGRVEVVAGRNVDLGNSVGIVTRGNLDNPYLPEQGADILVAAGIRVPDYAGFLALMAGEGSKIPAMDFSGQIQTFVDKYPSYRSGVRESDPAKALAQNLTAVLAMPAELREPFLRSEFFQALRGAGREALAGGGEASYGAGRGAAAALFPTSVVSNGDINLFASQIKTEQGGGIELLAPSGGVIVGIANPSKDQQKSAANQGLFTIRGGNISAYVKNSFLVNQSRVFTLDGGDILVWADKGSIDAGSGAKTVSATPPPVLTIRNGQIVLDTSNSVSGSGIGVLASKPTTPASDLDLFAPQGAIDAGDAGLRSTGNVNLGAQVILNSSNIQAGGAVAGAPAPVASPAPAAAPPSPANTDKGDAAAANAAVANREARQGILTVEVLGGTDDGGGVPGPREPKPKGKDEDS